jgi:mono/diheme cytochrome c family protein
MRYVFRVRAACGAGATLALLSWVAPCHAQAPPTGPDDPSTVDAAGLYENACAPCHGRLGDGNGRGARLLGSPQPRDFTAGVFEFRSTPTGSLPTDDDLYRTISRGVPGTWMPAWEGTLTPAQRWALIGYVKGFSGYFADEEPDPPIAIPEEPGSTPELVTEGRFVYAVLKCWQCHGDTGRGDGPSADELTDDWDRRIRPYDFTRGGYKNGSSPSDVYRTLATGMSGTPMPAYDAANVVFPGDLDLEPMREGLGAEGLGPLAQFLAGQPTEAELRSMPPDRTDDLVERRLWALVYYLQSLEQSRGTLYWLFEENPELEARQ